MPRKGVVADFPKALLAMERVMARTYEGKQPIVPAELVLPPPEPPRKPGRAPAPRPGASVVVHNRAYPGARELLTDRLEAWTRQLPNWRVEQGFLLVDLADALRVHEPRLIKAMRATGWWVLIRHDGRLPLFFPGW